ncbi:MAG: radical SAM protein, partial [Candidatus Bathyarchaeia archaeon]
MKELVEQGLVILSEKPKAPSAEEPPSPRLDFLWVEITSRCNLHCIHCYAGAGDKVEANEEVIDFKTKKEGTIRHTELSVEELRKILDEAADIGCRKIQFTGGEPTLRDDLTELLEYAKARGFE